MYERQDLREFVLNNIPSAELHEAAPLKGIIKSLKKFISSPEAILVLGTVASLGALIYMIYQNAKDVDLLRTDPRGRRILSDLDKLNASFTKVKRELRDAEAVRSRRQRDMDTKRDVEMRILKLKQEVLRLEAKGEALRARMEDHVDTLKARAELAKIG